MLVVEKLGPLWDGVGWECVGVQQWYKVVLEV